MSKNIRRIFVLALIATGLTCATAAFAAKDDKAGHPWRPFDDRCVSKDVCL